MIGALGSVCNYSQPMGVTLSIDDYSITLESPGRSLSCNVLALLCVLAINKEGKCSFLPAAFLLVSKSSTSCLLRFPSLPFTSHIHIFKLTPHIKVFIPISLKTSMHTSVSSLPLSQR